MRARGVRFASITHAAGLSSTGDATLDAALPLRESYDVPVATAAAIAATRAQTPVGRVVAIGTTVVRALESAATATATGARTRYGTVTAGSGDTDLRVGGGHPLRVVDAIFTGMHEPGTSHEALLQAFAPRDLLLRAFGQAQARGCLGHEFGDSMLVGAGMLAA